MKRLFLYIYYFLGTVYYRGLGNTLKMLRDEMRYEKLFGIKTFAIKRSEDEDNHHYQGASYRILIKLLKKLPDDLKKKPFIDYGSGKGKALFTAEYCGYNKLIGVELDKELVDLALENEKNYTQKRKESSFEFVHQNALEYAIPPDAATFYFFNPFSENIMKQVAEKLVESKKQHPRPMFVIYLNPKYKNVWENTGAKLILEEKNGKYTEAVVYEI